MEPAKRQQFPEEFDQFLGTARLYACKLKHARDGSWKK